MIELKFYKIENIKLAFIYIFLKSFRLLCIGCLALFGRAIKRIFDWFCFNGLISWHLKHFIILSFSDFINSIATNTKPHCTIRTFLTLKLFFFLLSTLATNQFSNSKLFKLIFVIIFKHTKKMQFLFPFLWLV